MNIFQQFGIRDVANACLYSIELDENDNEIYVPVLYMDTLKVSTIEENKSQVSAQGGIGNPKLITWDYGKDITITLEDALFTPASNSMNWGGKLTPKGLKLYLQHFYDRNTDSTPVSNCLRTGILNIENFIDFFTIPDRWPAYEKIGCCDKDERMYVGKTSIYCWLVNGSVQSDDGSKNVRIKELILFYREQTQKWYFFNGVLWNGIKWERFVNSKNNSWIAPIEFQYGRENFDKIRQCFEFNQKTYEIEAVAIETYKGWNKINDIKIPSDYPIDSNINIYQLPFLTQNLYIDGYRPGCSKNQTYRQMTEEEHSLYPYIDEETKEEYVLYVPYRFFANVGVEYNTNIRPPQDVIYELETAEEDIFMLERMDEQRAKCTFCIDADINMAHGQYRFSDKYSETALTVYIDPTTMQPFQPNAYEYYTKKGVRITGNLVIIKQGQIYYKWTREKAKENRSLGKQIVIDAKHFPGNYKFVGDTYKRNRLGEDEKFQFEIPLCKLSAENKIVLEADGEPSTFTMNLTALRRRDGVMAKLTSYLIIEETDCSKRKDFAYDQNAPERELYPLASPHYIENKTKLALKLKENRDYADMILSNDDCGFYKSNNFETSENENGTWSKVALSEVGKAKEHDIDGTYLDEKEIDNYINPDEWTATIRGVSED